ncbi:glycerate kinase [Fibrisoma montanum]|nr:glycerate kinase [Fibrisoma montanum]
MSTFIMARLEPGPDVMRVVLAPDKFRGSLTARQVADAMAEGVRLAYPDAEVVTLPLADGGEGTAEVLAEATHGTWHTVPVRDPLGRPITAGYGMSGDGLATAFIEMAQASGLRLLASAERNPLKTSSVGTGDLIQAAIEHGARSIVLGIGGSATNDAGTGMASALGWRFQDEKGQDLIPTGATLRQITRIHPPFRPISASVSISVACDVTNPLTGSNGAAVVYGPQKGATPSMVDELDAGLVHVAQLIKQQFGVDLASVPGAGAAGGLGAGALFFLKATLKPGVDVVLDTVAFDQHVADADLVITGEGKMDEQTLQGKLLMGVAKRTQKANVPIVALCGTLDLSPADLNALGLVAAFSILNRPQTLDEAVKHAYADVRQATFAAVRLFFKGAN